MNKGFTIIELLVMMGIILLLGGGVVAAFNNFNENQRVKQAALAVKSNLRFAQNKALSGEKPSGCGTLVGYTVTFAATSYVIQAQCDSGLVGASISTSFPSGVSFVPVPSSLTFAVLTGRIAGSTSITLSGLNKTYSLTVSGSGNVSTVGF